MLDKSIMMYNKQEVNIQEISMSSIDSKELDSSIHFRSTIQ
jgi:hypothetical protein